MTTDQMIAFSIYVSGALLLSLAAVLTLGTAMEVEGRFRRFMVPSLFLIVIGYLGISTALSGRNVSTHVHMIDPAATILAIKAVKGLAIVTALTACLVRLLAASFSRGNSGNSGSSLFVAFCLFFLTNTVLTSAFGTQPDFMYYHYYAPFLFAAVFASRTQDPEIAIRFAKCGLLIFLAGSCIVAIVAPDLAIQRMYAGWIPGITIRFWGLASHANSMAPLALLYLLVTIHQPFERRWLRHLGLVMAVTALVLAQSKTTWVAAAFAIPLLLVLRSHFSWTPGNGRRAQAPNKIGRAGASLVALGVLGVSALLVLPEMGVSVDRVLAPTARSEIATLTGRDIIWAVAVDEWRRNPLFGYGVTMWDDAFRIQIGLDEATSAHNQFLESLGAAGLVGLIGLIAYVGTLLLYAINSGRATRGLSVAVFTMILVRCFTETPLEVGAFLTSEFLAHLLLFHLALGQSYRVASAVRPATTLILPARGS
jgi:O-antigen ligase